MGDLAAIKVLPTRPGTQRLHIATRLKVFCALNKINQFSGRQFPHSPFVFRN
jgi:hypothetical protein